MTATAAPLEPEPDLWSRWLLHARHGGDPALHQIVRAEIESVYGHTLARRALATFGELSQAIGELEYLANPTAGEARIGVNESLTERTVDFIVTRGIFPVPEDDLNAEVLFEEPLVAVAGSRSHWARRRSLKLAELSAGRWILYPPNEATRVIVEAAFRARGLEMPRPILTASSFHVREALLGNGDYLTIVPACMVGVFNSRRRAVKILPVDLGIQKRPVALFTLKGRMLNPVAELVAAAFRAVGKGSFTTRAP